MFRYFSSKKINEYYILEDNDFHHIKNVVCLKINELVEIIFNDCLYICEIYKIDKKQVFLKEIKQILETKKTCEKTLLIGLIKGDRWDYMLQKCVELGIDKIVPINFQRNVVKIEKQKISKKLERWQKICESAAKQSKRLSIPLIYKVINVDQIYKYKSDLNFVAWENEHDLFLENILNKSNFNSISFVVGPEGGITDLEIEILKKFNFLPISLGSNILRAETAPLFILSIFNYLNL